MILIGNDQRSLVATEMERDVIAGHGASRLLRHKLTDHSDGYTEYICRCGHAAIVNHREKLYKCKYCKGNADIVAVPTCWASKLAMQEIMSCNVGIRRIPKPFTFETLDDEERSKTVIEKYDEETIRKLNTQIEDMIDDSAVGVDDDGGE